MLRLAAFLMGCLFCLGGLMALGATQGWVPSSQAMGPGALVFTLMGAVLFTGAGLAMLLWGLDRPAWAARLAAVAVLAFVLAFNWIAFGPGERHFTRSISVSSATANTESTQAVSQIEGRVVFGLFSVALDAALLLTLAAWWRERRRSG